jgi:tRNA pseudouridine32 synthase/23S rRNA pseudouridine746 synthase
MKSWDAPLPVLDGVAPSRVFLPRGPWRTLLEFLAVRFPYVGADILRHRLETGQIVDDAGVAQAAGDAYRPQRWLWYYREVPDEAPVPFEVRVLYRDSRLVVIDKPHFLPSVPSGRYLRETALVRLRRDLQLPALSPLHRLDRETAGVMLFCVDPACRGAYQSLFQARRVRKVYEAVAPVRAGLVLPLTRRSRLRARAGAFTVDEVEGEANSETRVQLLMHRAGAPGLYRLLPATGHKHQLRAHMSALGIPILNDTLYPEVRRQPMEDYERPLQLLAREIRFLDPFDGTVRCFRSERWLAADPTRREDGDCFRA